MYACLKSKHFIQRNKSQNSMLWNATMQLNTNKLWNPFARSYEMQKLNYEINGFCQLDCSKPREISSDVDIRPGVEWIQGVWRSRLVLNPIKLPSSVFHEVSRLTVLDLSLSN